MTTTNGAQPGDRMYAEKIDAAFDNARPDTYSQPWADTGATMADAEELIRQAAATHLRRLEPWKTGRSGLAEALAAFQAEYPSVLASSEGEIKGVDKNGNPYKYKYKYADLAAIHAVCLPLLGKHGLAWSCKPTVTKESPTGFGLVYQLLHGPSGESDTGVWPLPDPIRTSPQAMGSAITYAKRYSFSAATGVAPGKDDDDAAEAQDNWRRREEDEREERRAARQRPPQQAQEAPATQQAQPAIPSGQGMTQQAPGASMVMTPIAQALTDASRAGRTMAPGWFPTAWADLMKVTTVDASSPWKAKDGGRLTWGHVFGRALAATIEAPKNLLEYGALVEQLRAIGQASLPWAWEGVSPVDRLATVRQQLELNAAEEVTPADELNVRIAAATTRSQLLALKVQVADGIRVGVVSQDESANLMSFIDERLPRVGDDMGPTDAAADPAATDDAPRALVDDGEPYPGDPWDDARPVQDVELPVDDVRATTPKAMTADDFRVIMRNEYATPSELAALPGRLDGAYERGELSAEEASQVHAWLTDRPSMEHEGDAAKRVAILKWMATTSATEAELDELSALVRELRDQTAINGRQVTQAAAAISARRNEIKKAAA